MKRRLLVALAALALFILGCSDDECPTCTSGPLLQINKHKVDFGPTGTTASFTIDNIGSGSLAWDLTISYRLTGIGKMAQPAHGGWLEASAVSGANDATITLTADRAELDEIGVAKAVVIINAPQAENSTRDSVEVFILNSGEWLITDDAGFEDCWEVDSLDYFWLKGFFFPKDQDRVFVDSVALNFCQGDTIIQLIGYDSEFSPADNVYVPVNRVAVSSFFAEVETGWNIIPVDWYFSSEPFYVGYFQPGSSRPDLRIDNTSDSDTLCWRARDVSTTPGSVELEWQWVAAFETFAIRVFVTPVLSYNPKMVAEWQHEQSENTLRTGYAAFGKYPMSVKPPTLR